METNDLLYALLSAAGAGAAGALIGGRAGAAAGAVLGGAGYWALKPGAPAQAPASQPLIGQRLQVNIAKAEKLATLPITFSDLPTRRMMPSASTVGVPAVSPTALTIPMPPSLAPSLGPLMTKTGAAFAPPDSKMLFPIGTTPVSTNILMDPMPSVLPRAARIAPRDEGTAAADAARKRALETLASQNSGPATAPPNLTATSIVTRVSSSLPAARPTEERAEESDPGVTPTMEKTPTTGATGVSSSALATRSRSATPYVVGGLALAGVLFALSRRRQ